MSEVLNVEKLFGENVFTLGKMQERLPKKAFAEVKRVMEHGGELDNATADVVAKTMKDWAVEHGATHYTHWFQPLTGITAEKHDSFVTHPDENGKMLMEFSGKELIKGEADASSFPSGGLRSTFEARGYTVWDITSPAFLKEDATGVILCIPTAFCSYGGEVLDKKTPLLRSMEALSAQAVRILRLFGDTATKRVITTVGAEQEYFLIDKKLYDQRPDLLFTGRTLFGARAPKSQELEDHYFGAIKPRIAAFMKELDEELWKLGILAKTKHNEVAPAQHELAPIFSTTNVATDHNQITMETMKNVAQRHGLVCLLHEKPFAGVNGSGKHNNWSISTDTGKNLFEPGKLPQENAQFLLFLAAVIKGVDEYQDLLRISVASAGNDHRLGANEAPPAIVSVYIGDELQAVVEELMSGRHTESGTRGQMDMGVLALPPIPVDTSDRNRTSPFAFTGNKFEFRMPGASQNLACTNVMLNTAVADALAAYASELEAAPALGTALPQLIRRELRAHSRILFNGNGYGPEWPAEAERRGLLNLRTAPEAFAHFDAEKNLALFARHGVYSASEVRARKEIAFEEYAKTIRIEADTMLDMLARLVLPAGVAYSRQLAEAAAAKAAAGVPADTEKALAQEVSARLAEVLRARQALASACGGLQGSFEQQAFACAQQVVPAMGAARAAADALEGAVAREYWPMPTYSELLFYV